MAATGGWPRYAGRNDTWAVTTTPAAVDPQPRLRLTPDPIAAAWSRTPSSPRPGRRRSSSRRCSAKFSRRRLAVAGATECGDTSAEPCWRSTTPKRTTSGLSQKQLVECVDVVGHERRLVARRTPRDVGQHVGAVDLQRHGGDPIGHPAPPEVTVSHNSCGFPSRRRRARATGHAGEPGRGWLTGGVCPSTSSSTAPTSPPRGGRCRACGSSTRPSWPSCEEHPDDMITVVVDATFGHRIDPRRCRSSTPPSRTTSSSSPPAGAIGRGDAFVLTIANKAGAVILSNDSFQEFHGEYPWLFDEGRLIGGKPVPHVGWVFVPRVPVRGPVSRRAVRDAGRHAPGRRHPRPAQQAGVRADAGAQGAAARCRRPRAARRPTPAEVPAPPRSRTGGRRRRPTPRRRVRHAPMNELLPFLEFVERHPIGSTRRGHDRVVLVARRLRDRRRRARLRPAAVPRRSARPAAPATCWPWASTVPFVVVSFNAPRRGIDLAVPGFQPAGIVVGPWRRRPSDAASAAPAAAGREAPAAEAGDARRGGQEVARAASRRPPVKKAPAKRPRQGGRGQDAAPRLAGAPAPPSPSRGAPAKKAAEPAPSPRRSAAPKPAAARSAACRAADQADASRRHARPSRPWRRRRRRRRPGAPRPRRPPPQAAGGCASPPGTSTR